MKVGEILQTKDCSVYTISPLATLSDAAKKLVEFNVGSLVVCSGDDIVGIITERDILRGAANSPLLERLFVRDRMSTNLITGTTEDAIVDIMGIMTRRRIRHLPVVDDGVLAGVISIGDVVKAQHDNLRMENQILKALTNIAVTRMRDSTDLSSDR